MVLTSCVLLAEGGGSSLPSNVTMGRAQPPNMQGALEEYSRTGDVRVLQQFSALMGSPAVVRFSWIARKNFAICSL